MTQKEDPFQVLIATLLSVRTQDATTLWASTRLFKAARPRRVPGIRVTSSLVGGVGRHHGIARRFCHGTVTAASVCERDPQLHRR